MNEVTIIMKYDEDGDNDYEDPINDDDGNYHNHNSNNSHNNNHNNGHNNHNNGHNNHNNHSNGHSKSTASTRLQIDEGADDATGQPQRHMHIKNLCVV